MGAGWGRGLGLSRVGVVGFRKREGFGLEGG